MLFMHPIYKNVTNFTYLKAFSNFQVPQDIPKKLVLLSRNNRCVRGARGSLARRIFSNWSEIFP
jgi:hypothetical protein